MVNRTIPLRQSVLLPPPQNQPPARTRTISNNKDLYLRRAKTPRRPTQKIIVTHCFDTCHGLSRGESADISLQSSHTTFRKADLASRPLFAIPIISPLTSITLIFGHPPWAPDVQQRDGDVPVRSPSRDALLCSSRSPSSCGFRSMTTRLAT